MSHKWTIEKLKEHLEDQIIALDYFMQRDHLLNELIEFLNEERKAGKLTNEMQLQAQAFIINRFKES